MDKSAEIEYYCKKFPECQNSTKLYRLLNKIGYANPKSSAKSALNFFPPQDIIDYTVSTYSVQLACSNNDYKDVLFQNSQVNSKFSFSEISFQQTLTAFKKASLKSKGTSAE